VSEMWGGDVERQEEGDVAIGGPPVADFWRYYPTRRVRIKISLFCAYFLYLYYKLYCFRFPVTVVPLTTSPIHISHTPRTSTSTLILNIEYYNIITLIHSSTPRRPGHPHAAATISASSLPQPQLPRRFIAVTPFLESGARTQAIHIIHIIISARKQYKYLPIAASPTAPHRFIYNTI